MAAKRHNSQHERGAVALFVVVFATLLMIVITISFVQLMIKDQRQATASDLSQSAYDSAKSGVEDAKRLLLLDQACRNGTAAPAVNCTAVTNAINAGQCNTIAAYFGDPNDPETMIQQNQGDSTLQQSYTCVKIVPNTIDYKAILDLNQSNIVPLKGVSQFDSVRISWFTHEDVATSGAGQTVAFPNSGPSVSLPQTPEWEVNMPSLLRAQLMQFGPNFKLSDFDDSQPGNKSNANTLFLYPSATGVDTLSFGLDTPRRSASAAPQSVRCNNSFLSAEYACSVTLSLPDPMTGNAAQRTAFLNLSALYNGANYKVELLNAGTVVEFDHVQPKVDSTGRANNMFRRVESRIEFKTDFAYPQAAVDIEGDLCKNFVVTDKDPTASDSFGYPTSTCKP
ncbi:MAG TPA: hypothetical protein VF281_04135 [Candidatus Saccharimonadales bacterium]